MAAIPRFDFSLNLDLIGEMNAQDSGPKSAKDKDAKRLARCGKCHNCKSQDCGSCYNCADKPKFGGPGIKKQACINRKCQLMVPRDEEGEKMQRKRSKQRGGPGGAIDARPGGAGKPFAMPATLGFGTQSFNTGKDSPPSSPDVDWRDERESVDSGRNSPLLPSEATGYSYFGQSTLGQSGPTSTGLEPAEPNTGLTQAQTGLTPYFTAQPNSPTDELPDLFGDKINGFGLPSTARSNVPEFPRTFIDERINQPEKRDMTRDWTWNNPLLLQEEFILMNDLHRRESAQPSAPISAF